MNQEGIVGEGRKGPLPEHLLGVVVHRNAARGHKRPALRVPSGGSGSSTGDSELLLWLTGATSGKASEAPCTILEATPLALKEARFPGSMEDRPHPLSRQLGGECGEVREVRDSLGKRGWRAQALPGHCVHIVHNVVCHAA